MSGKHQNGRVTGNAARTKQVFRASELRYRRLFETAQDGILILDAETGRVNDVNPFLMKLLGFTRGEMVGKTVGELSPFKDIVHNQAMLARLQTDGYIRYHDLPLETKAGRTVAVEFVSNVYQVGDEKVIQCNIREITERKRAEEALRTSQLMLGDIINALPARVFWKDKNLVYLGCNTVFARDAGFAGPKDIIGKDDNQMVWREQAEAYRSDDCQVIGSGQSKLLIEESQTTPDGKTITLLSSKLPLRDARGEIIGMMGTYLDITARKQAEEALRASEEQFRAMFELASIGMAQADPRTGQWLRVNKKMCDITGYPAGEMLQLRVSELTHPDDRQKDWAAFQQVARGEKPDYQMEKRYRRKDGTVIWVNVNMTVVRDATGQPVRTMATIEDITERKRAEEALRQSREEFKNLFDNAPVGFHEVDAEGRLVRINNTELTMLGYSAEELPGQFVWKLSVDEETSRRAVLAKLGGEPPPAQGFERRLRRKDGSAIPVLVNDRILKRKDGAITGIRSTIQDITARKEAEAKLKANEAKFRALFEGSIYPIGLSKEGIQIMGNPAYAKLFGDSDVSANVGNSIFDDLVPEERPRIQEFARRRAMGDPIPTFYETRAIRRDGTVFDMAVGVSTYDLNGVVYSIRILRDITEHKRVQESQARLAMVVEQAAETVVITDTHGTILYANPAFEKTSGYTRAEALGRNPRVLKSGRHDDEFYRRMWEVLGRGETWSGHFINKRKDGAFYEEEATISPVRDAAGTIVNFVAVKRDVTREVQLETQFRQAQKMEAIGQLAGGVAHDFNNILSVIQGYSDLLTNDGQLSPAQADYAVEIGTAVMRGAALSRQLLLFSRKEVLQPLDLDLNASINEMTKMLRRILGENIQLQFKFAMQDVFVHADAGMMDQVLLNLAVNARDAMPKGGQLVIETSAVDLDEAAAAQMPHARPGSFVCLSVSDTGCGISAEHLPRIFEPFFTTKDVGKGTGLGLATVFGIVQQHQGWIHVSSETGHGTMFRIYLPRLTGMSGQKAKQPGPSAARGGDETILLVEDDEALRASVRKILSQLGYCVLEAVNGVEALKIQEQYRDGIHLLLTDMMMPGGMTGKDLGERLLKKNPKLKVIYASGYSAEVASGEFPLKAGVNFLTKPFQAQQLAQTVRQMLDENSETHSNASHDSAPAGRSCD